MSDNSDLVGREYIDADSRMSGRRVKVVGVFFNTEKKGRLKAGTWYAKTERVLRWGEHSGAPYIVSLDNLRTRYRPAPVPGSEDIKEK